MCGSCSRANTLPYDYYQNYVVVQSTKGKDDARWTDYLFYHLSKRAKKTGLVVKNFTDIDASVRLNVHIDPQLGADYQIERERLYIQLTARTPDIMLWLIYQFIAGVAEEDTRFNASDLPPAIIEPVSQQGTMAFQWRSIYTPTNADPEMLSIRGTNNVDFDWELWGHNLYKAVGMKPDYQAEVGGKRTEEQYCFSSEALFKAISDYITENFGQGTKQNGAKISIVPQDNMLACQCKDCLAKGNTATNATPAVTAMISRLAKRFPNHRFFLTAYATTKTPPSETLPQNVGVIVSAIDIPMRSNSASTKQYGEFDASLKAWKAKVKQVYVWDYMRNFDDYLTPYPCMKLFASRVHYYTNAGVTGLFVNGSGNDYASFDDLQTFVLSALLINPDSDVDKLIRRFFHWYYPQTADVLADYYIKLENQAQERGKTLDFYGGIAESKAAFLDETEFEAFWTKLDKASKQVSGDERKRLNTLLVGLNYTRLELIRSRTKLDKEAAAEALAVMNDYIETPNMRNYRESDGKIADYIAQWKSSPLKVETDDGLLWAHLQCSASDADGQEKLLTDGRFGFASDYHTAWMISSDKQWTLTIPAEAVAKSQQGGKATLTIYTLLAPKWHLYNPAMVTVTQGNKQLGSQGTPDDRQETDRSVYKRLPSELQLKDIDSKKPIQITLLKAGVSPSRLAIDEIIMKPSR